MRKAESAPLFQFHKGSIKTGYIGDELVQYDKFRFHKGSIKTGGGRIGQAEVADVSIPQRFD